MSASNLPKAQLGSIVKAVYKGVKSVKPAYKELRAAKASEKAAKAKQLAKSEAAKKAAATRAANKAAKEAEAAKATSTKAKTSAPKTATAKPAPKKKTTKVEEQPTRMLRGHNRLYHTGYEREAKEAVTSGSKKTASKKATPKKTAPKTSTDKLTKNVKRAIVGTSTGAVGFAAIKDYADKNKKTYSAPSTKPVVKSTAKPASGKSKSVAESLVNYTNKYKKGGSTRKSK